MTKDIPQSLLGQLKEVYSWKPQSLDVKAWSGLEAYIEARQRRLETSQLLISPALAWVATGLMFIPCSPLRVQSSIAKTCPDGKVKVTLLFLLVTIINMVITVAKRAMTTLALRLRLWTAATGCWSPGADQNVTKPTHRGIPNTPVNHHRHGW